MCDSDNDIKTLPDIFVNEALPFLTSLRLVGNDMRFPPKEVCDRGLSSIRAFFAAYRVGASRHHTLKVILLGEGEAGKTSLIRGAQAGIPAPTAVNERTALLSMLLWEPAEITPVKLRFFDIGGQPIYFKLTLRFFLTRRTVYVLVVDLAKYVSPSQDHHKQVQFWIDEIQG